LMNPETFHKKQTGSAAAVFINRDWDCYADSSLFAASENFEYHPDTAGHTFSPAGNCRFVYPDNGNCKTLFLPAKKVTREENHKPDKREPALV